MVPKCRQTRLAASFEYPLRRGGAERQQNRQQAGGELVAAQGIRSRAVAMHLMGRDVAQRSEPIMLASSSLDDHVGSSSRRGPRRG